MYLSVPFVHVAVRSVSFRFGLYRSVPFCFVLVWFGFIRSVSFSFSVVSFGSTPFVPFHLLSVSLVTTHGP